MRESSKPGLEIRFLARNRLDFLSQSSFCRSSRALRPLKAQQSPANHEDVGQRARHDQPVRILHQAAVAHFGEPEDALDDAKGMFDAGAYPRLGAILCPLDFID